MGSELPDLPERRTIWSSAQNQAVLLGYDRGDLKTRDEMDEEAARVVLETGGEGLAPASWAMWTERILDAAWGVTDEH